MNESVNKNYVLFIAVLGSFITPFLGSSVNIALPSIGKEFSTDAITISWIATSYLLAAAIFLVPFGRAADIYGRKRIFTYGVVIYTVSSFLSAVSPSILLLLLSRILQGVGGALIFGTCIAILTSVFPVGERGKALGVTVAAVYLGLSLGPVVGGILTQNFGWRSIFLVNVPLGLLLTLFVLWKVKGEWAEAKGERLDASGSIIFAVTLAVIIYGFSLLPALEGILSILGGCIGLILFFRWEMRVKSPILNVDLFRRNTVFTFSNLAALINYCATFAVSFLLSLYLQYIKNLSPQSAGLVLISQPLMQAIFSPLAGKLSDKIEPRLVASAGMMSTVVGLSLLIALDVDTSLTYVVTILILLGLSFALFSSPNTNAVMSSVERKFYGVASATVGTMRLIGQMLSMGIVMLVFALYIGKTSISPESYPVFLTSMKTAFSVFSVLCVFGVFASLARGNLR
ncbi:MFS transporter [[Eubacterium] cellulosolvens]